MREYARLASVVGRGFVNCYLSQGEWLTEYVQCEIQAV